MALEEKRRSLLGDSLFTPPATEWGNEYVFFLADLPYELEARARTWLSAQPLDRKRYDPIKGAALTEQAWSEFVRWMLDQLDTAAHQLPMLHGERIRMVVFDCYGTLARIGDKRMPYERLMRASGADAGAAYRKILTTNLPLRDMAHELGVNDTATLASIEQDLAAELVSIELYPGVLETLQAWRDAGLLVALASDLAMPYAEPVKKLLAFDFDAYAWSFEVGKTKRESPDFFTTLCERMNVSPGDTLMIGDHPGSDHQAARAQGLRAILLTRDEDELQNVWKRKRYSPPIMTMNDLPRPDMFGAWQKPKGANSVT